MAWHFADLKRIENPNIRIGVLKNNRRNTKKHAVTKTTKFGHIQGNHENETKEFV